MDKTVTSSPQTFVPTGGNDNVVFALLPSDGNYWKPVLKMWKGYNLWLIIGVAISLVMRGSNSFTSFLFVFLFLSVLALIYSCIKRRQILAQLLFDGKSKTIAVTILRYGKPKRILLAPQKEVKLQVRKRYRYRYPLDCLVILMNNKEIYVQEEVYPSWTAERFTEIEQYFKGLNKPVV